MAKEVRYIQNWGGEVAPALLITHQKSSRYPKLEPIIEEGPEKMAVVVPKRIVYFLPVALSLVLYFLIYKDLA